MTEPAFTRDGTSALYWADPADPVAGFLAGDPDSLGNTPTLTATWADAGGGYVFLGAAAGATFLADLATWLADHRPQGPPRFLWVVDPGVPVTEWVTTELLVSDGAVETTVFQLADYVLAVTGGNPIAPAEVAGSGWGFALTDSEDSPGLTLYSPIDVFFSRIGTSVLSMEAGHTGSWRFVLDAASSGGDAFERLGAGMRYFTPGVDGYVNAVHFGTVRQPQRDGPHVLRPDRPAAGVRPGTDLARVRRLGGSGRPAPAPVRVRHRPRPRDHAATPGERPVRVRLRAVLHRRERERRVLLRARGLVRHRPR
jgi:hypothetical protein